MKEFKFGVRSIRKMNDIKPILRKLCDRALSLSDIDFGITEGLRAKERQTYLVSIGRSWTMNSYHLTGDAIDFACYDENGKMTWDFSYFEKVAFAFYKAADQLNLRITWGGTWDSMDGPHIQLEKNS